MKAEQIGTSFPLSAKYFFEELDKYDIIKEIFNVILLSDNQQIWLCCS